VQRVRHRLQCGRRQGGGGAGGHIEDRRKKEGNPIEIDEKTLERQCDPEYVEQIRDVFDQYDAVVSMACGVGPQFLSEAYPSQKFFRRSTPSFSVGRFSMASGRSAAPVAAPA
jgi:hypothetical protein